MCELKIDGFAISLTYEDGRYVRAATRGDGRVGEDMTANVATIKAVPAKLKSKKPPKLLEVRGEVFMPIAAFEALNKRQAEAGDRLFANPRNSAAGSVRQKDPSITASRELAMWTYQLGAVEGGPTFKTHSETLEWMRGLGLPVNPEIKPLGTLDEVYEYCRHWQEHRHGLPYEIDGVVVKVDDLACATSSAPRRTHRGGRSRTSSRRRSAPPSSRTSWCRSAARGRPRRSPCSSRCSSVDRPCRWRRCTTRIK